jgi:2-deoxy-D-gluconate 3-dehydrogenase
LGAAIALALAEAGAHVALHGSRKIPIEVIQRVRATGANCVALTADLTDSGSCHGLVERTITELGSIDILINNAGITRRAPALEFSVEDWNDVIAMNLTSVFRLCQSAARPMLERGYGKIVNIASLLSFQGGITVPSYAAAKGGVAQITKALANEWASRGVQVNAIAPGYMATELTQALQNDATRNRQILERIPAGRWGSPEDMAGAAVFLSSPASDYINGHILVVDGGWLAR